MSQGALLRQTAVALALLAAPSAAHAVDDDEATPAVDEAAPPSDEPEPDLDERSLTAEIWTAMGSGSVVAESGFTDAEFFFMTGVLGLFRSAPFEAGLALDFGSEEDNFNVLFGPVGGLGFDLLPGLRVEALVEVGAHLVDGIGYDFTEEDGGVGDTSKWLLQGGMRLGLSGRLGRDDPRVVIGGWVAMFRDFGTTTTTITFPEGGGTEEWQVGGTIALLAVRLGFEW